MPIDNKPSKNEDEYFARQNAEALREMRAKLDAERANAELRIEPRCPRDGTLLTEQEIDHVKLDVCPSCKGVWLDAGELEQLRRVNRGRGVVGGVLGSFFKRQ
jgi:uncharacterized protein